MAMERKKLEGKIAIITGGAQDIGKVTAEKFINEGAKVIIGDINRSKCKEIVSYFEERNLEVYGEVVDVTSYSSVERMARRVNEKFGHIDILINNAGISKAAGKTELTPIEWKKVIDLNLTGVLNCTKAFSSYMVKSKFGRIINTSSLAGIYGDIGQANYSATKSGVVGLTKVWARELSRYGITVNAIAPGFISNEVSISDNFTKSIEEKIPVGRLGSPEDLANAYLFLASNEACYISGSVLTVDGGYSS